MASGSGVEPIGRCQREGHPSNRLGREDPAAWQEVYRTLMQVARLERQEYFTAVALLLRETHWEKGPWPSPALSQEKITAVIDGLLTMIEDQDRTVREQALAALNALGESWARHWQTRPSDQTEIVQLRLDGPVPDQVEMHRSFELATTIRQIASAILAVDDLTQVRSGELQVAYREEEVYVRLRIQITAPECDIHGSDFDRSPLQGPGLNYVPLSSDPEDRRFDSDLWCRSFRKRTILAAPRWKHMHMRDWPVAWR